MPNVITEALKIDSDFEFAKKKLENKLNRTFVLQRDRILKEIEILKSRLLYEPASVEIEVSNAKLDKHFEAEVKKIKMPKPTSRQMKEVRNIILAKLNQVT